MNEKQILEILKRSPFILEVLFAQNFSEKHTRNYMWGTITDDEVDIIKEWLQVTKRDLDILNLIINKDVDIWLLRNCDYENYVRIRNASLIDSKVYCDDGAIVENQLTKDEFNRIQERIDNE